MRKLIEELDALQKIGKELDDENARLQLVFDEVEKEAFERYMRPFWWLSRSSISPAPAGD